MSAPARASGDARLSGTAHLLFARDIGARIDLGAVRARLGAESAVIGRRHSAPAWFEFDPAPLRITQHDAPRPAGPARTSGEIEIVLYEFGAASVSFALPFEGTLETLVELSCALTGDEALEREARARMESLLRELGEAVQNPRLDELVEDYLVLHVAERDAALTPAALIERHGADLARVLRSERLRLSAQEVEEALVVRESYSVDDLALVDWNVAVVFDRDADAVRAVLEFANVQLLEMRFLDRRLDESLDRSWELLRSRRVRDRLRGPGPAMVRVAQLQVDAALLYESVTNALKLLGDQYLARVWNQAGRRLRLPDWTAAIRHKLDTLDRIHGQFADRASALRLEALEWIVIGLIALSIVLSMH